MAGAEAPKFGVVDDPYGEWEEIEPFPFTIVGYTADEDRTPQDFSFSAIGRLSLGAEIDLQTVLGPNGKVDNQRVIAYLIKNLVSSDRGRFDDTISDDRWLFHAEMLVELADWLVGIRKEQAQRPTGPSSVSSRGRLSQVPTSARAAAKSGSARTRSR